MFRNVAILLAAAIVIALPFIFRKEQPLAVWQPGDPELVIISAHNEAIRYEFGHAFSEWHVKHFGKPVRIDWRAIGGTSEISRYLTAEFISSARAWWVRQGRPWSSSLGEAMVNRRFNTNAPPELTKNKGETSAAFERRKEESRKRWELERELWTAFRATDAPGEFTAQIDLFFGGGEFDHAKAAGEGLSVPPWPENEPPPGVFADADGRVLIPQRISGETWRSANFFGNAAGTFGIVYNIDRLKDLGIDRAPERWDDLAEPRFYRQLGAADPTKSGSIAKAFELIIHQKCHEAVEAAGFTKDDKDRFEAAIKKANLPPGVMPPEVPQAYQDAIETGWLDGVRLIQKIGANARYFTDSASKVPIDVSTGNAAVGIAIDFYGRYQAEKTKASDGTERMVFVTPRGGSGASCDPISLLRGAKNRDLAVRFIQFVLGEDGQKLWTYRPGTPGGPKTFSLRRLPIRRDFYPSEDPVLQARHEEHQRYAADNLAELGTNPYAIAEEFTYYSRWTGQHFGIQRDLIRAMCMDAGKELQAAWDAIQANGGPAANPEAMEMLERMPIEPDELTWKTALSIPKDLPRIDYMRKWTLFFRQSYQEARDTATRGGAG